MKKPFVIGHDQLVNLVMLSGDTEQKLVSFLINKGTYNAKNSLTNNEIAESIGLGKSWTSQLLNRLHRKKILFWTRKKDARRKYWYLGDLTPRSIVDFNPEGSVFRQVED